MPALPTSAKGGQLIGQGRRGKRKARNRKKINSRKHIPGRELRSLSLCCLQALAFMAFHIISHVTK